MNKASERAREAIEGLDNATGDINTTSRESDKAFAAQAPREFLAAAFIKAMGILRDIAEMEDTSLEGKVDK